MIKRTIAFSLLLSGLAYGQISPPAGGGGGGGATIPSTTNLINGDGAGNGADSGIVPANVGLLSGTQTFTGSKTFSSKSSFTSSTATTITTPTLAVVDNEAAGAALVPYSILVPNMAASNSIFMYLGKDGTTTRNSAYWGYKFNGSGLTTNSSFFSFGGMGNILTLFGSTDVAINTANDNGFNLDVAGSFRASTLNTTTNCSSAASPAVCAAAASGSVVVAAAATTVVVNTTAVTANSQILLTSDASLGTKLGVTCNVTPAQEWVSVRTAATSFTITLLAAPVTNPQCLSYSIVN